MLYYLQDMGTGALLFSREGNLGCTVLTSQEKKTGAFILVHQCFQEKEIGAIMFSGKGNWMHYLLFSGEGRCSSVFRRREKGHYCFQDKGPGAQPFSGERNWCTAVLSRRNYMCSTVFRRREHLHYCNQDKETGALLFSEKEYGALLLSADWCTTYYTGP